MRLFVLLICGFFSVFSYAQNLAGKVVTVNNEPIFGATVYFDGSTIGTTTNEEGKFVLPMKSTTNATLIVSYVGYETVYVSSLNPSNRYTIKMTESVTDLVNVVVEKPKFSREEMLKVFRNQFIGKTKGAKNCKIKNEDEIYFSYDSKAFTFYAYSDVPLEIQNEYLGYKVFFDLKIFEVRFPNYTLNESKILTSSYFGTSRFQSFKDDKKTLKIREEVFEGSSPQLFRSIAKGEENGKFKYFKRSFQVPMNEVFTTKDTLGFKLIELVTDKKEKKFNEYHLNVLDTKKRQSKIVFKTPSFFIDEFGLYTNYDQILFGGYLSEKKIADMLPTDYNLQSN